jgi:hypothetical protein
MKPSAALLFALICTTAPALHAQSIERMKLTDGDLTCPQIYAEVGEMEKVMGIAKDDKSASANTSAAAGMTQQATGVAVHAAAMSGSMGAAVGLAQAAPLLGLFGNVAKAAADSKEKESAERMADAKARKEHLTGLFVSKGCKLSDVRPATTVGTGAGAQVATAPAPAAPAAAAPAAPAAATSTSSN